jgi:hypothetical protein
MLQLSHPTVNKALRLYESTKGRLDRYKEKTEELTDRGVRTLVGFGSAYGLGMAQGAGVFANGELLHVPAELFFGLSLHGLALFGVGGRHAEQLANAGDGCLFSLGAILGRGMGAQHWGKGASVKGEMSGGLADRLRRIANS